MRSVVVLALVALCLMPVSAKHRTHSSSAVIPHHNHNHNHSLARSLEEESPIPAIVLTTAGSIAVNWVSSWLYELTTASTSNMCVRSTKVMNTWSTPEEVDVVGHDLLRFCKKIPLEYTHAAREKRHWHVHSHTLFLQECLFDFEWQFVSSAGAVYDCFPESIIEVSGQQKYDDLVREYGGQMKFFRRYVGGLKVDILDCDAKKHDAYVAVYPSLPYSAFSTNRYIQADYASNPVFFINVEGWTYGSCSGWKEPGVRWVFQYKVDVANAKVKYVTKFPSSGPHRPEQTSTWVRSRSGERDLVFTYEEKSKGFAEELGINMEG